jgi:hypothetical protein
MSESESLSVRSSGMFGSVSGIDSVDPSSETDSVDSSSVMISGVPVMSMWVLGVLAGCRGMSRFTVGWHWREKTFAYHWRVVVVEADRDGRAGGTNGVCW